MSIKSDQWIRRMADDHGMVTPLAMPKRPRTRADMLIASDFFDGCEITSGSPEAGGGGAAAAHVQGGVSAATGIEGGAPAGAGSDDDDDGGDADPEPARRRPHTNGTAPVSGETLLRLRGVQARVPLSKSAIYKLIAENRFPQPIRLSARCSLWRASEIDAFVSSLA